MSKRKEEAWGVEEERKRARGRGREDGRPLDCVVGLAAPHIGRSEGKGDWRGDKVGTWKSVGLTRQPL